MRHSSLPRRVCALLALLLAGASIATACGSSSSSSVQQIDTTTTTGAASSGDAPTTTTTETPAGAGTQLYVYTPVVGDCIDRRSMMNGVMTTNGVAPTADGSLHTSGQIILRLDCERPHQYEVILDDTTEVAKAKPQSPEAYGELAKRICPAAFPTYIGRSYQDSKLEFGWIAPTDEQRARGLDFLGCTAFDPKGRLTGSVRGADR